MPYSLDRRHFMRLAGLGATGLSALGAGLAGCSFATADTGGGGTGSGGAGGSGGSTPAGGSGATQHGTLGETPKPLAAPAVSPAAGSRPDGPNVIVILTDQQRADVCRREGFPLDTTPFLDALATRGVWFNRAYTSCPACVPARTSLLTGRFPAAAHVRCNHNLGDATYEKDLFTAMRERGYKTALIGKNHSFLKQEMCDYWSPHDHMGRPPRVPEDEALNAFLKSTHFHVSLDPCPLPVESQNPVRMVDDARTWIDSLKGSPFFLWFSIPEPHNPYQVPEPYYSMFPPDSLPPTRTAAGDGLRKSEPFQLYDKLIHMGMPHLAEELPRMRSNYFGMLRLIDDQIKRLMEYLDERGLRENTIVVFLSDHGDFVGEYGWMRKGPDLPECLARVPMIWTGPGIAAGEGPHAAHVSMVDIFPTLCEATGIPIPDGVQGRSLWPLLTGRPYPKEEFASAYV